MAKPLVSVSRPGANGLLARTGRYRSWAARPALEHAGPMIGGDVLPGPAAGDVALFEVRDVSTPGEVLDETGSRQRLQRGTHVLGVFGNCQSAGVLEARVSGLDDLGLMDPVGLVGTVRQSAPLAPPPTRVSFLGYGLDRRGERLNLRSLLFHPCRLWDPPANTFLVVGASPDSGERTALAHLRAELGAAGLRVGVCRLTRPGPADAGSGDGCRDLCDYGFLSSCGCTTGELRTLFHTMLADLAQARPDVVLVAIEGGILQREAARVLSDAKITRHVRGVVLTAACAPSALFALRWLGSRRHRVVAVSGVLSSAPLLVGEFSERATVPVGSADGVGRQLVHVLLKDLKDLEDLERVDGLEGLEEAHRPGGATPGREQPADAADGSGARASARWPVPHWRRAGGGAGG